MKEKIFLKGENKTSDISHLEKCGGYYKVTFKNGKKFTYNQKNVEIKYPAEKDKQNNLKLDYFKELASISGLEQKDDDGGTFNILLNNFTKIDNVRAETVLSDFLSEQDIKKQVEDKNINIKNQENFLVYPFGFNISQKEAVEKAISNKISIIEGPPGTGKTQTILNIIANAIINDKTVAVVSSNNSATKNVIDKLKKYNVDFIAAYLGNIKNKQEFIDSQKPLPNISSWAIDSNILNNKKELLKKQYVTLQKNLNYQIELAKLKQELSSIEIEFEHHKKYTDSFNIKNYPEKLNKIKSFKQALQMSISIEMHEESLGNENLISKFFYLITEKLHINIFKRNIIKHLLEKYPKNYLISICQQKFYEKKILEIKQRAKYLSDLLQSFNFKNMMKEYSKESEKIFKASLENKYSMTKHNIYTLEDLNFYSNSNKFIKEYPVVLSTTYSLMSSLNKNVLYDYLIVDEASQVDICTGVLALSCAKKAIIVGDLKQLPNVVKPDLAKVTDSIFEKYNLPESYRYKNNSLLSAMIKIFSNAPKTLLREHYRCHPKIIDFCNKKFYDNQLIILTESKSEKKPLIIYKTVEGNHARAYDHKHINQRQIDVIQNEIIPNENLCLTDGSIGIVTPYRKQADLLQKIFKNTTVKADTVDKFQGRENKVIILSTVDNEITDFSDDLRRLNVIISRAIEQLIIVINANEQPKNTNINDLLEYMKYNNCDIKQSKVYSVFDYLYSYYEDERKKYLKKYKKISIYDSENIMYITLKNILEEKFKFANISISVHVPLKMIIQDNTLLSLEETQYLSNSWTHVDFLLYNKITKKPFMVIEVDGDKYHRDIEKERNKLKEIKQKIVY